MEQCCKYGNYIIGDPDYKMKCIGFWKENLKSYLITYDELDPLSKYKCWVYQRADLNRVLMSQGKFKEFPSRLVLSNARENGSHVGA